jgi:ketosteroid isomerase-like protein
MILVFAAILIAAPSLHPALAQANAAEEEVWKLEEAYWRYVKALDLNGYRTLWHENFVGWPSVEKTPVGKAKIGNWITSATDKGQTLRNYELRRQAVRAFGDVVVAHYLVTRVWADKSGKAEGEGLWFRITHTWMKVNGKWLIITGMSAEVPKGGA